MSFQWMIQNAGTTTGAAAEGAFNSTQTLERKKLTKSKIQRRKGGGGGGGTYGVGAGIRKSKARRNASWNLIAMSAQRTQREAAAKAINVKISKIVGGAGSGFKSKKREALMAIMREGKQNVATRVTRKQNGNYSLFLTSSSCFSSFECSLETHSIMIGASGTPRTMHMARICIAR